MRDAFSPRLTPGVSPVRGAGARVGSRSWVGASYAGWRLVGRVAGLIQTLDWTGGDPGSRVPAEQFGSFGLPDCYSRASGASEPSLEARSRVPRVIGARFALAAHRRRAQRGPRFRCGGTAAFRECRRRVPRPSTVGRRARPCTQARELAPPGLRLLRVNTCWQLVAAKPVRKGGELEHPLSSSARRPRRTRASEVSRARQPSRTEAQAAR